MKKLLYLLLSAILLTSCSSKEYTMYEEVSLTAGFDTFLQIQIATQSKEEFDKEYQKLLTQYTNYNQLFDIYNDYPNVNNLKTINDKAGIEPVKVDQELIDMLLLTKEFYEITHHEFDITMGPVLKVWHQYREEGIEANVNGEMGKLPSDQELQAAYACTGWDKVEINDEENTVFLNEACASLDVGGVAKGYAAEQLAKTLEEDNIKTAIVNAGGNNRTVNTKLDGTPWRSLIQNPDGEGGFVAVSALGSTSFVTSGDYQRFYVAEDGNRYSHIIDPRTLYPADKYRSVTVVCQNSAIADILSTSLFTLDFEEGLELLQDLQKRYPNDSFEALWIIDPNKKVDAKNSMELNGYQIVYTDGLKDAIITK
ncbi:MAG: FAD:protein FMN transferase [Erysipelotrichaceae bacterium]|nr:FAD:protein FMN transferase [Erysipelotrichaceae bacterium]